MSAFVIDNSLQTTRHAMHQVFAIFSCNLLHPYVFYCHFHIFSTSGMFICHTLSFCIAHKFSIGLRSGLLVSQFNILILFLRKSLTNFKQVTRSTVLHEHIAFMNSHVNFELVLQHFAILDTVYCCSDW